MKHKFIAKRYWKDQSTAMGQSDEMAKSFDDVINLSLGDPDMTTPEPIIEAAFRDAKAGNTQIFAATQSCGQRSAAIMKRISACRCATKRYL